MTKMCRRALKVYLIQENFVESCPKTLKIFAAFRPIAYMVIAVLQNNFEIVLIALGRLSKEQKS